MIEKDIIVVGYGGAGAIAAISAAQAGADVLLVEKMAHHGGTTMLAGGFMRVAQDARQAAAYLARCAGGRCDASLVDALAVGMTEIPDFLRELAEPVNAEVEISFGADQAPNQTSDLYDWPGRDTLGWAGFASVPGFERYPWVHFARRGQTYMRVLEANVERLGIEVWFEAPAKQLIHDGERVTGLVVEAAGERGEVRARKGVILASGGFAFNRRMLQDFLEIPEIHGIGPPGATGDGIAMAQAVGADLWHMWHVHGSYGFRVPEIPAGLRMPLGGARQEQRPVAWILVDQLGRRFGNEVPPAPQDFGHRLLQSPDPETGTHPRIPCWMIFDDAGRQRGPIARPISSVPEHYYAWSPDNSTEVAKGWIQQAPDLATLAEHIGVNAATLTENVNRWNGHVARGLDSDFGRPAGTFHTIAEPPFFAIEVRPVVSNTQGGPRHDAFQRVLKPDDQPIPGLYAVGELGSFFGHVYLLGGNLSEGVVGGRVAANHALNQRP